MSNDTLTALDGVLVGHAAIEGAFTGCTVVLPGRGAVAGVDVRGGAPGTYGTDTLNPINLVDRVHALFFTGGSAFGLGVADGLRRFLQERGLGFDSGHGLVPIIAGAVIFDLGLNPTKSFPDAALGYRACLEASSEPVAEGCVGAGMGATVGKLHGLYRGMKSGLGSSLVQTAGGLQVAALMVVNAFGDVLDPASNGVIAGCRVSSASLELLPADRELLRLTRLSGFPEGQNTTVGVVATNAALTKTQLTKVAQMAHDGMARTVSPAHTQYDGDTIFALSCGSLREAEVTVVGALAAQATAQAILRAVRKARPVNHMPVAADLTGPSAG